MGIGTSSSSSGASAPHANAYTVNPDASELRRSRAEGTGLSPAWPDACHLFGMWVNMWPLIGHDSAVQVCDAPASVSSSPLCATPASFLAGRNRLALSRLSLGVAQRS